MEREAPIDILPRNRALTGTIYSLHVFLPHFGNSYNIANLLILIIFVMVICDFFFSWPCHMACRILVP